MPFDDGENRKIFELCYRDREKRVNPLAYWNDADIWNYSRDVKLEQCSLYLSLIHILKGQRVQNITSRKRVSICNSDEAQ